MSMKTLIVLQLYLEEQWGEYISISHWIKLSIVCVVLHFSVCWMMQSSSIGFIKHESDQEVQVSHSRRLVLRLALNESSRQIYWFDVLHHGSVQIYSLVVKNSPFSNTVPVIKDSSESCSALQAYRARALRSGGLRTENKLRIPLTDIQHSFSRVYCSNYNCVTTLVSL